MSDGKPDVDTYALTSAGTASVQAPLLDYLPPHPHNYHPRIALVGAGGIASAHLDAYRHAGFDVAVVCSRTLASAQRLRDEFYPSALVTDRFDEVLRDASIEVLDITPHPADRLPLIEQALRAGKHVLSQKPFVTDLADGQRLVNLAIENGVRLAVNQNGRWSPHMAWMREAVQAGLIGELTACHVAIHWDHRWIAGTPFEQIDDLIFHDFAIHWFDFLNSVAGPRALSVFAMQSHARGQDVAPPMLAQALVRLDGAQASLVFDAVTPHGPQDTIYMAGTLGSLCSTGPDLGQQRVTLTTAAGRAQPELRGSWFNDGFRGAMGELLCAIEQGREPANNAQENMRSLALAFAAIQSARSGVEVALSDVEGLPAD